MRNMITVSRQSHLRPEQSVRSSEKMDLLPRVAEAQSEPLGGGPAALAFVTGHSTSRMAAVMFPINPMERMALAAALGGGWEFQDGRSTERAAAVLLRPCSSQTVAAVRRRFPDARIVVVEDAPFDGATQVRSQIRRLLEAGADVYLAEMGSMAA